MSIDVTILGEISVTVDGQKVQLGDRRQRLFLGLLAHDLHVVENVRAMNCLWTEAETPGDPKDQIQGYVSRLRSALPGGDRLIRTVRGIGYELTVAPEQVDRHRFANLKNRAETAEQKDPGAAARLARQALREWRHSIGVRGGRPLADCRVEAITSSLQQEHRSVALLWLRAELKCGRHELLLPEFARLATDEFGAEDPELTRLHMLALVRSGRSHDALSVYERHEAALNELLFGSRPTKELQSLKGQIMRNDENLTPGEESYAEYGEDEPAEDEPAAPARPSDIYFSNHQTGSHAKNFQAHTINFGKDPED